MSDTSGFYKVHEGNTSLNIANTLIYASTLISGPEITLIRNDKDNYTYPIMGWYWFDSEEEARTTLNVPVPVVADRIPVYRPEPPARPVRPARS